MALAEMERVWDDGCGLWCMSVGEFFFCSEAPCVCVEIRWEWIFFSCPPCPRVYVACRDLLYKLRTSSVQPPYKLHTSFEPYKVSMLQKNLQHIRVVGLDVGTCEFCTRCNQIVGFSTMYQCCTLHPLHVGWRNFFRCLRKVPPAHAQRVFEPKFSSHT